MERLDQAKQDAERSTPPPAGKGKEREAIPSQVRESSSIYERNILIGSIQSTSRPTDNHNPTEYEGEMDVDLKVPCT